MAKDTVLSAELSELYADYYGDAPNVKRRITASQSVDHITKLAGGNLGNVLDVGSGEGAVLQELEQRNLASGLTAVEISRSGIERTQARNLKLLKSIHGFDGYKLPFPDKSFDLALAIHVLEHVEHERMFLAEIVRVARKVYVEVPLEHTFRLKRSIALGKPYGHINHYTFDRFLNVLDTSGLHLDAAQMFPNSLAYEVHLSGKAAGTLKHIVRSTSLKLAPYVAPSLFVYLAGAICH